MKTILLPVDFSLYSAKAADFALSLFPNEELKLIFLYTECEKGKSSAKYTSEEAIVLMNKESERLWLNHSNFITKNICSNIELITLVERVAKSENVDFVILGTKGQTDLAACRNGSLAGYIIKRVAAPVITVPQHFSLRPIRNIIFATDLKVYHDDRIINQVVALAKTLDARIHLVNVHNSGTPLSPEDATAALRLEHEFSDVAHLFHFYNDFSPIVGLERFVDDHDADLLVTVSRHENAQQSIWYKSITKLAAEKIELPLLAYHD